MIHWWSISPDVLETRKFNRLQKSWIDERCNKVKLRLKAYPKKGVPTNCPKLIFYHGFRSKSPMLLSEFQVAWHNIPDAPWRNNIYLHLPLSLNHSWRLNIPVPWSIWDFVYLYIYIHTDTYMFWTILEKHHNPFKSQQLLLWHASKFQLFANPVLFGVWLHRVAAAWPFSSLRRNPPLRQVSSWVWWSPRPCPWEASPPHPRDSNWRSVTRFYQKKTGEIRFSRGGKKCLPKTKEINDFSPTRGNRWDVMYLESFFSNWLRVLNSVLTTMKRPYFLGGLAWGYPVPLDSYQTLVWQRWNAVRSWEGWGNWMLI